MSGGTNFAKLPKLSDAFPVELHKGADKFAALKAYNAPGTGGLFSAAPLVATVDHSTPLPACWPLADSARIPPGQSWELLPPWALGLDPNVVPLNAYALSESHAPQS